MQYTVVWYSQFVVQFPVWSQWKLILIFNSARNQEPDWISTEVLLLLALPTLARTVPAHTLCNKNKNIIKSTFSIIFRLNFGLRNKQYINWTCFLAIKPRIKIGFRPLSAIHFVKYINLNSRMWFYSSHGTKIHKKQKAKLIMFSILMFIVRIHEKYIVIEAIMIIIIRILILYSDADDLWLGFRLHKARSQEQVFLDKF
jgi:hypothetical protein